MTTATPSTWHIHWAVLIRGAADAQLPVVVRAPALDPAARHDRARVVPPQGDGGGGDACGHGVCGWRQGRAPALPSYPAL